MKFKILLLFSFNFLIIFKSVTGNECTSLAQCTDCIRTAGCVWCKNTKFSEPGNVHREYTRCNTIEEHLKLGICNSQFLENPGYDIKIEEEVEDEGLKHGEPKIRIAPSSASLRLRVGEVVNVSMEYYDTENKPLDLYYIMDLSATMADDKSKVGTLGSTLAQRIRNLTSNVKIGFGSFIDKPIKPFVSISQLSKEETETTTAPYAFKNHLSLTSDIPRFQEEVRKSKTSGNLDAPEGVLEAVLQGVLCKDVIGWRPNARHLLIVSTDGPFHIAGDAKLGGILKPNDCLCHMTKEGNFYTESTTLDYPSIAQVNAKVKEENVFVIFAVTEEHVPLYTRLAAKIEGSATRTLKDDSENVVELVEQEYKKIITSIELPKLPPQFSKFLRLNYYAKCSNELPYVRSNRCQDMKIGSNATFQLEVELLRCPSNARDWTQILSISPVGVAERLLLNLDMICDCACETAVDEGYQENDILCEGKGTPRCGICDCAQGHIGKNCQCSDGSTSNGLLEIDDSGCQMGNSTAICSNRGSCICGQCVCNQNQYGVQVYSGTYCECDDSNCPAGDNGRVCSGQGICKCSKCACATGFVGDSCACSLDEDKCREPGEESTCSSRGYCKCGKCVCESPFTGRLCQNCPNCPGKCEDPSLKACIHCYVQKLHNGQVRPCHECDYLSEIKDMEEVFEESDEERSCFYRDENRCETKYIYHFATHDRNKIEVRVERKQRCPSEFPIIWIILGIIGSFLIGGIILLLCWKFVTYYHDLKEWTKFKKEIKEAKWHPRLNPLYKEATSNFMNPIYRNPNSN